MPTPRTLLTRLPALALALALVGLPRAVHAGEPSTTMKTITLSPAGPSSTVPIDAPFVVGGEAKAAGKTFEKVHVVFVRYWWGPWGAGPRKASNKVPSSCSEVEAALDGLKPKANFGGSRVEDIWQGVSVGADGHWRWLKRRAQVLTAVGDVATDGKFAAVVAEPRFFHPDARYCVFVYASAHKTTEPLVNGMIAKLFETLADERTCKDAKSPTECRTGVVAEFVLDNEDIEATANDEAKDKLIAAWNLVVLGSLDKLQVEQQAVGAAATTWSKAHAQASAMVGAGDAKPIPLSDAFARVVAQLLARQGILAATEQTRGGKSITIYSLPGKFTVETLTLLTPGVSEPVTSLVFNGRRAEQRHVHAKGLASLVVPGTDGAITLEDLRQLTVGRLPGPNGHVEVTELIDELGLNVDALTLLGQPAKRHDLERYRSKRLEPLVDLLERLEPACETNVAKTDPIDEYLCKWLVSSPLAANNDQFTDRVTQLKALEQNLRNVTNALTSYENAKQKLIQKTGEYVHDRIRVASEISPTLSLESDGVFSQYVSGFTGVSLGSFADGSVELLPYVGAHMFAYPNQLTQPMWSNRAADLRRFVGIEFGVRAAKGEFGPDDRYQGVSRGRLPVMFVGALLQPLPYTFVSFGVMLSDYQRSTLPAERSQLRASWYVGLNLDANLVGFIRQLISGQSEATATKAK